MKINKKKAVKWVIWVIWAVVVFGCVLGTTIGLTLCWDYWIMKGLSLHSATTIYILAMILTIVLETGLATVLISIFETNLSSDMKEEFIKQLEERKAEDGSQYVASVSDHGDNLDEVMEAIRHEEWEYYAFFDLSEKKLAEGTYKSPSICCITTEDWQKLMRRGEEVIGLHNHPRIHSGSFSEGDFAAFVQHDFIRQYIVVTRKYNYILAKTGHDYEKFHDEIRTYAGEMFAKYLWLGELSERLWSVLVSKKTAKKFGLEFHIERAFRPVPRRKHLRFGLSFCAIMAFCLTLTGSPVAAKTPLPYPQQLLMQYRPYETMCVPLIELASMAASSIDEGFVLATPIISDGVVTMTTDLPGGTYVGVDTSYSEDNTDYFSCNPLDDPYLKGNAQIGGGL